MYDAINKGFASSTGNIMAWINCDDFFLPMAFSKISKVFTEYPEVTWLKGITAIVNPETGIINHQACSLFNQDWIEKGIYGRYLYFINQDSVFWKKELWQRAGPIKEGLRLAGDYYLWANMAKHTPLYSLNSEVSCYRNLKESLGQKNMARYRKEQEEVVPIKGSLLEAKIKLFFGLRKKTKYLLPTFIINSIYKYIFGNINIPYFELNKSGQLIKKFSSLPEIK